MRVSFWGVRGSFPGFKPGAWHYGSNTPCLEVRAGAQTFILDAGSGIQALGRQLKTELTTPGLVVHLLLTHYHWDHIQGLLFFEPIYFAGNTLAIFGPRPQGGINLEGVLQALFRPPFFPVPTSQLKSTSRLEEIDGKTDFALGDTRVRTCRLNHPQGALAYRLDQGGASMVYATDHEPGDPASDRALRQLARGADLLISDAQYSPEELPQKAGWGHGSWESAVAIARDAGVKTLLLFHHDPFRSDQEIDQFVSRARHHFPHTWAATEGMLLELTGEECRVASAAGLLGRSGLRRLSVRVEPNPQGARNGKKAWMEEINWQAANSPGPSAFDPALLQPESQGGDQLAQGNEASISDHGSGEAGLVGAAEPESSPAEATVLPAQRRYERISLEGTDAYGVLQNGLGAKMMRVLDVSSGGISFLLDEPAELPDVLDIRLNVPLLPKAEFRIRRVYTQRLPQELWRVGCCFSA